MPPKNQKKVDKARQAEITAKRKERNAARPSAGVLKSSDEPEEEAPKVMSKKQARQEAKKAKQRAADGSAAAASKKRSGADSSDDEAYHSDSEQFAPRKTVEEQTAAMTKASKQNADIIVSSGGSGTYAKQKWPSYVFLKGTGFAANGKSSKNNLRDITVEDFSLQVPGKTLIKKATLTLAYGHKYGILGRNGIGKSVLLRAISERDSSSPFGCIPANIRILHVQQEVTGDDRPPLETVLASDIERTWLIAEEERLKKLEEEKKKKGEETSEKKKTHKKHHHHDDDDDDDDEEEEEEDEEEEDDDDEDDLKLYTFRYL